jgi:thiamine pyrophosphate-dependent acetolactate synthase large subunit-like protein
MKIAQACTAIAAARKQLCPQAPLVATMTAQFIFDMLGETERRIDSVPLMGGAAGLGLGIALAQPDLPVIVVDGDSSLLMELGGLVTVVQNRPAKFIHFVMNNGVQFNGITNIPRPGSEAACDFAAMARAAKYQDARRIDSVEALTAALPEILAQQGATFVELMIEPDDRRIGPAAPQPLLPAFQFVRMRQGVQKLKAALAN